MERILVKISGESLALDKQGIIDAQKLTVVATQLKSLTKKYSVSIVIGAGNIWRGAKDCGLPIARTISDSIGMVGTVINATILAEALRTQGLQVKVFSPITVGTLTRDIDFIKINGWLNQSSHIAIFAGGTGNPYFTTDSGAALRASEIGAKWILMGKNGVDGVYSDDPKKNKKAVFFPHLTYQEILAKRLQVMDLTALTICQENKIKIKVFNAQLKNGWKDAMDAKIKATIIE